MGLGGPAETFIRDNEHVDQPNQGGMLRRRRNSFRLEKGGTTTIVGSPQMVNKGVVNEGR